MNILKLIFAFTILCSLSSAPAFAMAEGPTTEMEIDYVSEMPADALVNCHKKAIPDPDADHEIDPDGKRYSTFCQTTQTVEINGKVETFEILMKLAIGGLDKRFYVKLDIDVYSYKDAFSPVATVSLRCNGGRFNDRCRLLESLQFLHERGLNLYMATTFVSADERDIGIAEIKIKELEKDGKE